MKNFKKSSIWKSQENGKMGTGRWNWSDVNGTGEILLVCPSFTLHLSQQRNGLVMFQKEDPR